MSPESLVRRIEILESRQRKLLLGLVAVVAQAAR